jgi:hypothetical protein
MQPPPMRFTILQLIFGVAVVGIALVFLKSLVTFLNSPFLDGSVEEANWAPVLFASRTATCGVALWVSVTASEGATISVRVCHVIFDMTGFFSPQTPSA